MSHSIHINAERLKQQSEIFAELDIPVVQAVVAKSSVLRLAAGDALFERGNPYKEALFILYEGEAELRRPDGTAARLDPGALIGLSNYLDSAAYASTVVAMTPSTLLVLPAQAMTQLEDDFPVLFNALNHAIAERIRFRSVAAKVVVGALARPVRTAMKSPISTCAPDISLREAFKIMQERRIGSLGVVDGHETLIGLLTCSGISQALALENASPLACVTEAACELPHTIHADAPLWEADEALQRHRTKYLIVLDQERPVGMISQTDVLRALVRGHSIASERIAQAQSLDDLRGIYSELFTAAHDARETSRLASRAVGFISDIHLATQRRAVELTLAQLATSGARPPTRSWVVLIMGSGGRREMLLNPDQDNGIVISDRPGPLDAAEQQWFADFSDRLNVNLERVGYILCPGEVMARNPLFRKTLAEWKRQITQMSSHPTQKAARWSNIVFDFDTLYGDERLTRDLREHLLRELRQNARLLEFMVEDDAEGRPPLGLFQRLITGQEGEGRGKIDIKRNGLRIICDAARVYALSAGIANCNTSERLQNLVRQGVLSAELVDSANAAYEELMDILLGHQIRQREAGAEPDKLIAPEELSNTERDALRVAMRAVKRFQDQLQGRFGRTAF